MCVLNETEEYRQRRQAWIDAEPLREQIALISGLEQLGLNDLPEFGQQNCEDSADDEISGNERTQDGIEE